MPISMPCFPSPSFQCRNPELVSENKNGYKGVQYQNLVGVLIEAVKEQNRELKSLKAQIVELKNSIK